MRRAEPRVAATILDQLHNEARRTGESFNTFFDRYVAFRFLFRLSQSRYANRFTLKGATMFYVWFGSLHRMTRGVDLLSSNLLDEEELRRVFRTVSEIDCFEDGVCFDPHSLRVRVLEDDQSYPGLRATVTGYVGTARSSIQIDIGFGDIVTPEPLMIELPSMIRGLRPCQIPAYTVETVIAENFESLVRLQLVNSRVKDFVDLAVIADHLDIDGEGLENAVRATFERRRTALPSGSPVALSSKFWEERAVRVRWENFVRKNHMRAPYDNLESICGRIEKFSKPLVEAIQTSKPLQSTWSNGIWRRKAA